MKDSERILGKYDEHAESLRQLESEAAASGRRLTEGEKAYMDELRGEGSAILRAADLASKEETGQIDRSQKVTADTSGNLTFGEDTPAVSGSDGKHPVAGGGRLA